MDNAIQRTKKFVISQSLSCISCPVLCSLNCILHRSVTVLLFTVVTMQDLIGPYWALRAALGPLVETYVLLDRLLFLQEQGQEMKVNMVPLFDPLLSPRNVAIIAVKK